MSPCPLLPKSTNPYFHFLWFLPWNSGFLLYSQTLPSLEKADHPCGRADVVRGQLFGGCSQPQTHFIYFKAGERYSPLKMPGSKLAKPLFVQTFQAVSSLGWKQSMEWFGAKGQFGDNYEWVKTEGIIDVVFQPWTPASCNQEFCPSGFGGGNVMLSSCLELLLDVQ